MRPSARRRAAAKDPLKHKVSEMIRQWDGKLTRELLLSPGGFGLGKVPHRLKPDATTTMTCGYCSTGCGLNIHLKNGEAISLTPTTNYPVNLGTACPKGWEALTVLKSPDRATTPLLRENGKLKPVDWDTALKAFATKFKAIQQKYGNDSIAFIGSGQIPCEELSFLGALAKFGMGMIHGDANTRQCMATSAVAYKQSFGFDAPPFTYADFEASDVLVMVGANMCIAHPIMWERVLRNPHKPEIIVIDPRKTETALAATRHIALQPKSDLELFYGIAHILIREGWIDRKFIDASTSGFDDFAKHVQQFTPDRVSKRTGIDHDALVALARAIHNGKRVSFWWTMGVNQGYESVRTAQAIINLALMTGNIGRPGTGANSITGQCNAMGSRLFSNTTGLMGGHDFLKPEHREKVAKILGIDAARIPDRNSWAYNEILQGVEDGKIKGLWILATNPAHSWINQNKLGDILSKLEFLVVQDMYSTTETAQVADLVLPAAAWGEKEGTFINSERRFGVIKKVSKAPGLALTDFAILKLIAHYWGCEEMFRAWSSPEAVFHILKSVTKGQPCDITGIDGYQMLDQRRGIQWPYTGEQKDQRMERRLFEDGKFYHTDGRAKFLFEEPRALPESIDKDYPIVLLTGRGSASQWHTQTRTRNSAVLRQLYPKHIYVEINPADGKNLGISSSDIVTIESRRGSIEAKAFLTNSVQPGQVFIPMHYEVTNKLTHASFDPYSKQPNYKWCAVKVYSKAHMVRTKGGTRNDSN